MRDQTKKDLKTQDKNLEKGQIRAFDILKDIRSGTSEELNSRIAHHDEIVDSISNFMQTFQNTLKVLSSDL